MITGLKERHPTEQLLKIDVVDSDKRELARFLGVVIFSFELVTYEQIPFGTWY